MIHFTDRHNAGHRLAMALGHLRGSEIVVVGLAPGGVVVAEAVAHALDAPLDVIVVRDIEAPLDPHLLIAATATDASFVDNDLVRRLGVSPQFLSRALVRATWEVRTRDALYRGQRPPEPLTNKTVVLVDDGLASSTSLRAAIASIRRHLPHELIVAVPVRGPGQEHIGGRTDAVVCLSHATTSGRVSDWYDDFPPIYDEQVVVALFDRRVPAHDRETPATR
jgi:putative phosphoribosyl transferase